MVQLWTGFLGFYASNFDDKMCVVSVRQREVLTKFEKLWNSSRLAIEDPFDLSHNLSSGLSQKMWLHIKKAFAKGREVFGQPLLQLPPSNVRWLQVFSPHEPGFLMFLRQRVAPSIVVNFAGLPFLWGSVCYWPTTQG